jgi:hypothetical protein
MRMRYQTALVRPFRQDTPQHYRQIAKRLLAEADVSVDVSRLHETDEYCEPEILELRRTLIAEPWSIFATVNTRERLEEDLNGTRGHKLMGRMDRNLLGWAFNKRRNERSEYFGFAEWTRRNNYHVHFLISPAIPTDGRESTAAALAAIGTVFEDLYWWPFVERHLPRFMKMTMLEFQDAFKPSLHMSAVPANATKERARIVNYVTKNYYDPVLRDMALFRKNNLKPERKTLWESVGGN